MRFWSLLVLCLATERSRAQSNQVDSIAPKLPLAAITNALPATDPAAFKIIADRNIFNPNRAARSAKSESESKKPAKVDTLSLVGTLAYEKGTFAFFEGSSSEFKKVLQKDAKIGGCIVTAIEDDAVKLAAGDKTLRLAVGGHLRRNEDGPWEPSEAGASSPTSDAPAAGSSAEPTDNSAGASGGGGDILERLRKKREQEIKNEKP
jgi:hypothetical protein